MLNDECNQYSVAKLENGIIKARTEQKALTRDLIITYEVCAKKINQMKNDVRSEMNSERKRDKHTTLLKVTKTCNTAKSNAKEDKYKSDRELKTLQDCWDREHGVKVEKSTVAEIQFEKPTNTSFSVLEALSPYNNTGWGQGAGNLTNALSKPFTDNNSTTYNATRLAYEENTAIRDEEASYYDSRTASRFSHPLSADQAENQETNNSINLLEMFIYATGALTFSYSAKLLYCWGKVKLKKYSYAKVAKEQNKQGDSTLLNMATDNTSSSDLESQIDSVLINGKADMLAVDCV